MNAELFWENVKKRIKQQNTTQEWIAKRSGISFNTFQGWIAKGIYPRVNDAIRIASALNTSVEYLASGAVQQEDNNKNAEIIDRQLSCVYEHLKIIENVVKGLT
ncbi:MAG: helix-turn-helix domain-containing protein [Treponema sp.]|jgi:transcriptional regulator with XRE-family HTH domain|nr:helix-turn-helix domain-containing protein [Treponema sp.]